MLKRALLLTALAVLTSCAAASAQTTQAVDGDKVAELIQKLGSDNFAERERAKVELEKIGPAGLDALKKAAASDDLETSRRAGELVRKIEEKSANASILVPKRIHLKLQDVSVLDAVAELEKQSGYHIQIGGDQAGLKNRKITLDTGATTFWQAFDQLCSKAGLVEQQALTVNPQNPVPLPGIRRLGNIRLQPGVLPVVPNKIPQALPILPVPVQPNGVAPQLQAAVPVPPVPGKAAKNIAAQAQAIQIIQAVQNAQVQPGFAQLQFNPGGQQGPVQGLIVTPGTPKPVPTAYSGAVRIRVLPATAEQRGNAKPGETVFVLDVDAEPRLQSFSLAATPQIDKAIDDQGKSLAVVMDEAQPNANANAADVNVNLALRRLVIAQNGYQQIRQQAVIRLKGEDQAKTLKELSGTLSAQALTETEPVVVVKNILKAAGQTEKANGYAMEVRSVEKLANGDVKIVAALEGNPNQNNMPGVQVLPGGGFRIQAAPIQINGNFVFSATSSNGALPDLVDVNGKSFRLAQVPQRSVSVNNNRISSQVTMVFSPVAGQAEADRLVLTGRRTATFQVPFSFKDVPVE